MKIHGDINSGNCYKLKLLTSLLDIEHEWVAIDILSGETRTDEFLAKNPNGKIPLLQLNDGSCLSESNAILNFLAHRSKLLPADAWQHSKVLEWQFFEQYSHEPYIAVARYIVRYLGMPEDRKAEFQAKKKGGYRALSVMEQQLALTPFLVGKQLTIADISLYAYTHVCHEGGFSLDNYPAINDWLQRIESDPRYIPMH